METARLLLLINFIPLTMTKLRGFRVFKNAQKLSETCKNIKHYSLKFELITIIKNEIINNL